MKTDLTYGIYEGEIEPVLAAVRSQRPLAEIEAMPCPCCGARISVEFSPAGNWFQVYCLGEPLHISTHQEADQPPTWWKERVGKAEPITFYWQRDHGFADDGRLEMPASGYDAEGCHWSGRMIVRPDQADYPLWRWIVSQGDRYKALISDKDLETIREEFRCLAQPGTAAEQPRD